MYAPPSATQLVSPHGLVSQSMAERMAGANVLTWL
jgi:hypothetical protein